MIVAPLHAQAEARGDQHHRRKEQRPRQQRIEIEPMPQCREAGTFQQRDEARQLPERHRLGRGEAVLDLARGEIGRHLEARQALEWGGRAPHSHVRELPHPVTELRLAGIDALGELAVVGEEQHGDPAQRLRLRQVAVGMDDRMGAVIVALAQPQPGARQGELLVVGAQDTIG
jgi:hypothetical protein